jgi:ribonucleoside-diphosphate reductase beta chain
MAERRDALQLMAAEDPELAARLVLMTLPATAARIPGTLAYDLELTGLGSWRVSVSGGRARVDAAEGRDGTDFRLRTDPATFAALAAGSARPLGLMMRGRLHVEGRRRRVLRLRAMAAGGEPGLDEVVAAGGRIDPDLMYRALPYLVDPEWTRGHRFTIRYEVQGEGGGVWHVQVRDGERLHVSTEPPEEGLTATVRVALEAYERMATGTLTPSEAMQHQLTDVEGEIYPVTLLGRWIDRAAGRDDAEMNREERQRQVQAARESLWSADPAASGQDGSELLGYRQLYALWERQNWRAHELDFSADREHWLATPRAAQENTIWSLGSFYVGEERVTADLAPFLLAAPTGEIELFLATQLVDEARHAAFFDRFGAEVMTLTADDLRGRMREVERTLTSPWRDVFDDGLRDVAGRIKRSPDDLELFVEGIATYHMVVEGFLAVTGQTLIRDYMLEHGLYPGFCKGFGLVERDEHRHVAFGVRFLRDAIEQNPAFRSTVERVVLSLAPRAAYVFVPPYVSDPSDFVSYGYDSRQIYGFAYRTLKRRMKLLGIEIPPASEFMPGPIAEGEARVPAPTNGGGPAAPVVAG